MATMATDLPEDLLPLANRLLQAAKFSPPSQLRYLISQGAPVWYQDEHLGWSCLHYAAERREPECLRILIGGGAVWNAVDKWGRTAGEICLSLGDREGWEIIRNEGVRSEMLHGLLGAGIGSSTNLVLRVEDGTSAGNNFAFLKSDLKWEMGDDGRERVMDADGNGVMMGWEEPLMVEHVRLMTFEHPKAQSGAQGLSILNVGYGLGIIDRLFRTQRSPNHPKPIQHTIIEAHPQVLAHMREQGVYDWPGVRILEGRWQDVLNDPVKLQEVLNDTPCGSFDAIFVDTFAEGYEELKEFFEIVQEMLDFENGVFSFWNGLGATNPTIYSVSCEIAEMDMDNAGLKTEWFDVPIPESLREEVWEGVRRKYWELPGYRLPIAKLGP